MDFVDSQAPTDQPNGQSTPSIETNSTSDDSNSARSSSSSTNQNKQSTLSSSVRMLKSTLLAGDMTRDELCTVLAKFTAQFPAGVGFYLEPHE